VLPFANLSGDPNQQYFCDGTTEDIITELQRFRSLSVIARNSSFQYRDGAADIRQIGRELRARYIVEGSVRRTADRVRVTAQLIDAETAAHLWADRYDRDMTDLFAIQDEISRSIAATLWSALDDAEGNRAKRRAPSQMAAYDYVLKARSIWFSWTADSNAKARSLIDKALELDPQFATAWAWLAWVHIEDWRTFPTSDSQGSLALAVHAAKRAIELDPHDYFSHWPMAYVLLRSRQYEDALAEYEKTLAMNPNDSRFLDSMGLALCLLGQPDRAIAQLKLAMKLDPLHPEWFFGTLGLAHYMRREYAEAVGTMAKMRDTHGGSYLEIRAAAHAQLGHEAEAHACMEAHLKMRPQHTISQIVATFPFRNRTDLEHFLEGLRAAGMPE
jgi:adenylate cyclase